MSKREEKLIFEEVDHGPLRDQLSRTWNKKMFPETFVKFGSSKLFMPKEFGKHYEQSLKKFRVRDDDVWIISFSKAGTTWAQEMTWLILNDMDFESAKSSLAARSPYFDLDSWLSPVPRSPDGHHFWRIDSNGNVLPTTWEKTELLKSPRLIKTHLSVEFLPDMLKNKSTKAKIIYVYRNPKDVCVSYFHFSRIYFGYLGTLDEYVDEFIAGCVMGAPYWNHVQDYLSIKDNPQFLIISYEEMKKDLSSIVDKVASFLGKTISEEEKTKLLHHLDFEQMKFNKAVNFDEIIEACVKHHGVPAQTQFMRKGKVGSWKEDLSSEAIQKLDLWITQNDIGGLF